MKKINPLVTVVMPIYNGETFCEKSIQSVLNQTYPHFELLIIDDGSTDTTSTIVRTYTDKRIRIITNKKNCGISKSLNEGIAQAKGTYIARLDADDIMYPTRLHKQVEFLNKESAVGVVGSYVHYFGLYTLSKTYPLTHTQLLRKMHFTSPFCYPATLIRKSVLPKNPYRTKYNGIEDLDLWWRLSQKTKFATIPNYLTRYRTHPNSITSSTMAKMLIRSSQYRLERTDNLFSKIAMRVLILSLRSIFQKRVLKILILSQK